MEDPIVRLIPAGNGTQDLEVAFNTRAGQTYNVVSIDQEIVNGALTITDNATLVPNIIGTNGPVYQYISNCAVEWIGGYVPMETLA